MSATAKKRIYRVQDANGRGPWRPGFSRTWVSEHRETPFPPAIQYEFENFYDIVAEAHGKGLHIGCGVRGDMGLTTWFLPDEIQRLKDSGFVLVRCHSVRVLAESDSQVLFASRNPLHLLPVVSWPSMPAERIAA